MRTFFELGIVLSLLLSVFLINRQLDLVDRDIGILNLHIQQVESQLNEHMYAADSCSLYWGKAGADTVEYGETVKIRLGR